MNLRITVRTILLFSILFFSFISTSTSQNVSFNVDYPSYFSNHDIVYLSPPMEGYEGFPLGNGDLGAMIWCTRSGFEIQINKNDTWDQPDKESGMVLRSCGRLTIEETIPCFDWLYLNDFEARLSLYQATTTFFSRTPFNKASAESYIYAHKNVLVFKYRSEGSGDLARGGSFVRITLERWGSRAFPGWYNSILRDASNGLGTARAGVSERDIYIQESLKGLDFTVACRVISDGSNPLVVNSHRAEVSISAKPVQEFFLMVAVVTSDESPDPLNTARSLLDECQKKGFSELQSEHQRWWANFWSQSFVHLGDNYLENLYYFHLYLMGSSSRGKYPVLFNAGLWTWNHDVRQWVSPHHWNMQQAYWCILTSNHVDLLKPYLEAYWRLVPKAEEYAKSRGIKDAILWNEKHDYDGRMLSAKASSFVNDFTPASQIGQFFWNYYLYTGDETFLKEKAYPFIKKTAEFYLQYLKWDKNKKEFYIFPASPYECEQGNQFRNTITDLSMIRTSFRSCIKASTILNVDLEKRAAWQKVLNHLAPYPLFNLSGTGEVPGLAQDSSGRVIQLNGGYTFCSNTSLVFPSGDVGIDQQGTKIFDASVRRARLHPRYQLAISPIAVVSARLGMGNEARERLLNSIRQLQHFPQGFFYNLDHWHIYSRYAEKLENSQLICQRDYIFDRSCRYEHIKIAGTRDSVDLPMQPFIQCGLEPSSILAAAINEMLLQSHEEKIRVFPALPDDWHSAFTLRARGGFLVTSERDKDSNVKYVFIKSILGNKCCIVNPWHKKSVTVRQIEPILKKVESVNLDGNVIAFSTGKDYTYLITTDQNQNISLKTHFTAEKNTQPKYYEEAILGKPRDF